MPAAAELEPVLVVVSEEVGTLRRVLGRLARIQGHPALSCDVDLGPAVVPLDLA